MCETITVEWRLVRRSAYRGAMRLPHRRHSRTRSSEVSRHAAVARYQLRRRGRLPRARPTGRGDHRRTSPRRRPRTTPTSCSDTCASSSTSVWPPTWAARAGGRCRSSTVSAILRERREAELRAASAAAESLQNYLLAAASNQADDDSITVLLGTDAIVAARRRDLRERQEGDLLLRQAPVRRQSRRRHGGDPQRQLTGVAGPGTRDRDALRLPSRLRQRSTRRAQSVRRSG